MKKFLLIFTLITPFVMAFSQDIDSNLEAHYTFCGNLNDNTAHANHGEYMGSGTVSFADDRHGDSNSALDLSGLSEYVSVPASESLNAPEEEVTVALWFNYRSVFNGWITPFVKTNASPLLSRQYGFGINGTTGQCYMNTTYVGQFDFQPNTWYHAAITYTSDMMKCYVNGELIASEVPNDPVVSNDLPLEIGRETPVAVEFYNGLIDEIRIYSRALNASEIALIAEANDCNSNSISEFSWEGEINVFPVPFSENLSILFENSGKTRQILVYNSLGQLISETSTEQRQFNINTEAYPSGLYQVYIKGEEGQYAQKLLKK